MHRNGGAGDKQAATNGSAGHIGSANGNNNNNNNSGDSRHGSQNGDSRRSPSPIRDPLPPSSSASVSSSSPLRQNRGGSQEEGIELSREPWRQGNEVGSGWVEDPEKNEEVGVVMGGSNSRGGGSAVYEEVEREEPLLAGEARSGEAKHPRGQSMGANLLWTAGDNSSLRSGSDASLGPAFGRQRRPGSREEVKDGRSWSSGGAAVGGGELDSDSDGADDWAISGRPLVYLCAMCSSLCSILLGYDVGVMSGAKEFIKPNLGLSTVQNEVMVGSLNIVAAFGGLVAGKAADRLGRKPTTALACIVFITGATIMTMSHSYWPLLLGRVVTGVGVGCAMVIAPVYITELAPPDVRGMLVSLTDICINIGILFGYGASLMCSDVFSTDSSKWRSMVGIGMLPPLLILGCLSLMPESPRWLIATGRNTEALGVLKRVMDSHEDAERDLEMISRATSTEEATWKDVLLPREKAVQAALVLGVGLGFWQQASGSEAAVYYTPEVLKNKGWGDNKILKGNIGVGGFKLLGEVVAFMLLDRIGRRPLFLGSSFLVTVCLGLVGSAFHFNWSTTTTLIWLCMFMFTFSLGLGPVTFVVASEIFPVEIRGKAMSVVIFVNRLMSGLIALSYQSLSDKLGPGGSFFFFTALSSISVAFYYFLVPETRGKTLEEITAELGSSSPPALPGSTHRGLVPKGGPRHVPLAGSDEEAD